MGSLLQSLSSPLRAKLQSQCFHKFATQHGFLSFWSLVDVYSFNQVLTDGMDFQCIQQEHQLFRSTFEARAAYVMVSGGMKYTKRPASESTTDEDVGVGTWTCEACWWVVWIHVGDLEAASTCKVVAIKPN